jgi:hypothetical protein
MLRVLLPSSLFFVLQTSTFLFHTLADYGFSGAADATAGFATKTNSEMAELIAPYTQESLSTDGDLGSEHFSWLKVLALNTMPENPGYLILRDAIPAELALEAAAALNPQREPRIKRPKFWEYDVLPVGRSIFTTFLEVRKLSAGVTVPDEQRDIGVT